MTDGPVPAGVVTDGVAAARAYLRMADGAEAEVLGAAVAAAFGVAEAFCGAALVARAPADDLPQEWADLPGPVAQGIVLLVAQLVERRGGDVPPAAVTALWRPYRAMRLRAEAVS